MLPRLAAPALGVLAVAAVLAPSAAASPLPPVGSAAVVTQTNALFHSVTISAGDGRFAERDYDPHGALTHEIVIAHDTLTEFTPDQGVVVHHGDVGISDDRFDRWEPNIRYNLRRGTERLVGDDVLNGVPVHVLATGAYPPGTQFATGGPPPADERTYVDAATWVPLEVTSGGAVTATGTEQIVPVSTVESQLDPSPAARKAARIARHRAARRRHAARRHHR
jgi:hypothetical protein